MAPFKYVSANSAFIVYCILCVSHQLRCVYYPGDYVLAQFSHDKQWYRARVKHVIDDEDDFSKTTVEVIYFDFGNSEVVPVQK